MKDEIKITEGAVAHVDRRRALADLLGLNGHFHVEHWRDGVLLSSQEIDNLIVDAGMNLLLDQVFRAQAGIAQWRIGLVDNAGFSAFAAADLMSSHAGWAEFNGYSESVRQDWVTIAAAARLITNTALAVFSINASGTVHGIFITSSSTKGGATGSLWSGVAFSANIPVLNGDSVKVTYSVSG